MLAQSGSQWNWAWKASMSLGQEAVHLGGCEYPTVGGLFRLGFCHCLLRGKAFANRAEVIVSTPASLVGICGPVTQETMFSSTCEPTWLE